MLLWKYPFRNRSSSFSVGLPRSACATVSMHFSTIQCAIGVCDCFRNRSSSFSVGLLRSACAIVSIVSVFNKKILASNIFQSSLRNTRSKRKQRGHIPYIIKPQFAKPAGAIFTTQKIKKQTVNLDSATSN